MHLCYPKPTCSRLLLKNDHNGPFLAPDPCSKSYQGVGSISLPLESVLAPRLIICSRLNVAGFPSTRAAWHALAALLELCCCPVDRLELACWMMSDTAAQPLHRPVQQPARHMSETIVDQSAPGTPPRTVATWVRPVEIS